MSVGSPSSDDVEDWHRRIVPHRPRAAALLVRCRSGIPDLLGTGQISLINSHRIISLVRSSTAPNHLRLKANFLSGIKLIWVSSPGAKKLLLSENRKLW
jgi:hypothetical protein